MLAPRLAIPLAAVALSAAAPAHAADRLTIRGAGWGHGVGMSQWGAYGFAQQGRSHREILGHYYTGTTIGTTPNRVVRVLLATGPSATFTGATRAAGRRLNPAKVYGARPVAGGRVALVSPRGKRMRTVGAPLRARGRVLTTGGEQFRRALEFRPGAGGLDTINAVKLEAYLRGVVARESPASWPVEALKAQAVAARSYAITTSRSGTFDHYRDTRSQVYGGVAAEDPRTDAAIRATRGEVVTYGGAPVVTYFFSTSGGRTENVENSFIGSEPQPWLKSVDDPYDDASPHHRWTVKMSRAAADARLGDLVKGRFRGIDVVRRGVSPRIVHADVVGSRGRTRTTGPVLRARLGLRDTWARFVAIGTDVEPGDGTETAPDFGGTGGSGTAGVSIARRRVLAALVGHVHPRPRGGLVALQRKQGRRWRTVSDTQVRRGGWYRQPVLEPGRYRVRTAGTAGPVVRVRAR